MYEWYFCILHCTISTALYWLSQPVKVLSYVWEESGNIFFIFYSYVIPSVSSVTTDRFSKVHLSVYGCGWWQAVIGQSGSVPNQRLALLWFLWFLVFWCASPFVPYFCVYFHTVYGFMYISVLYYSNDAVLNSHVLRLFSMDDLWNAC